MLLGLFSMLPQSSFSSCTWDRIHVLSSVSRGVSHWCLTPSQPAHFPEDQGGVGGGGCSTVILTPSQPGEGT